MRGKFLDVSQAEAATVDLLQQHPELSGLFAVWDVPAIGAAAVISVRRENRCRSRLSIWETRLQPSLPITNL